jgi:glycine betaine/proline transport system substrate-binding protein
MRKLTVLVFAIAVAMVVAVAACGSEAPTATPQVSPPTTAPVVEEPTVMVDDMDDPTATPRPAATSTPRPAPTATEESMMEMQTVIFSDLNWPSAMVQNRIAQYILEKGYGYPTDVVLGATLPLLQGLRRGDTHVTMEIWLPNQNDAWVDALAEGSVQEVGFSLGADWQSAFVIPRYLQEQYPDLDSVEDLKDPQYQELFVRPESEGKAFLVTCVVGWACEGVNDAQILAYGLTDHVFVSRPGDGASANADLYGKYERQEPWLGYQWGTNNPALVLDLVALEEPAYNEECWTGLQAYVSDGTPPTAGCGYRDSEIKIAVRTELIESAPELIAMFQNWSFDIPEYGTVVAWRGDNPNADDGDSALWWLLTNEEEWSTWVTDEAAEGIRAALAANETPDGWPTE